MLTEGQMQKTDIFEKCTTLKFSVTSPHDFEQLTLYAEGPCKDANLSTKKVDIKFIPCSCLKGFQPNKGKENITCECVCDHRLSPYITKCNYDNKTVERHGNFWITGINCNVTSNYSVYPNCPQDYCKPPNDIVFIDFTTENGSDAQCANGRSGILCGTCQPGLSLSLGSTRCLQCLSHWPSTMAIILLAALLAGAILVVLLLVLNLTVAVGTLNGIIFYANIVATDRSTLFPPTTPRFATVFISWLNLEIGVDTCFFDGMDTYWKAWLQLAFPSYVLVMIFLIILLGKCSPRFAKLIGRKNPIATLCTMLLLSYTKFLQVVLLVGTPPYESVSYPDGSTAGPWLPQGDIKYFSGKHIALFVVGILILIAGIVYTILLTFWQCLVKWVKSPRICNFMEQYHAPYTPKHRYWTGMLLLIRVALYIIVSVVNVSSDPAINLLAIGVVMTLLLIHAQRCNPIYTRSPLEMLEMLCYMNLLLLCLINFYFIVKDSHSQTAAACVSTISVSVTILLLLIVLCYHLYTEVLAKVRIWLRLRRQQAGTQQNMPVDAGQCYPPEREDEPLLQAVDRGRENETFSERVLRIDDRDCHTATY